MSEDNRNRVPAASHMGAKLTFGSKGDVKTFGACHGSQRVKKIRPVKGGNRCC